MAQDNFVKFYLFVYLCIYLFICLFVYFICMVFCLLVRLCTTCMQCLHKAEEGIGSSRTKVMDACEMPSECCDSNLGPVEEQLVL